MQNPARVDGMDAMLYDVTCKEDWGSKPKERMFFMRYTRDNNKSGAVVMSESGATELVRCGQTRDNAAPDIPPSLLKLFMQKHPAEVAEANDNSRVGIR